MRATQLVIPIGDEHEGSRASDPASEQPEHIERGLVGPVHVLDHENDRLATAQLVEQRGSDLMRPSARSHQLAQRTPQGVGDAQERTQRARREERIAGAGDHPRRGAVLVAEAAHQRGLADTRFTPEEHQPAAGTPGHSGQGVVQRRQGERPLEEVALPGGFGRSRYWTDIRRELSHTGLILTRP